MKSEPRVHIFPENNLVTAQSVHDFIKTADAHQLRHALKVLIPKLGVSREKKSSLESLVWARFGQLNAEAANFEPKHDFQGKVKA